MVSASVPAAQLSRCPISEAARSATGVVLDNFANSVTLEIGSTITGGLNVGRSTAATLTLTDDGTGGSQLYSGAVNGGTTFSGTLVKAGSGTWIIDQVLDSIAATTIMGGVLQVGNADTNGSLGTGNVVDNATLAFNRSDNLTFANTISGSGALNKLGANTLTLTGANTYTGNTVVSGGTLVLNGGSTTSRLLRANAGTEIDYGGGVSVGGNLSGTGTQRVLTSGATFSTPTASVLTIFNGVNLSIGGPTTFNQVNNSGAVTVAAGQTLTWNDGQNDQGTLTANGTVNTSGWTSTGVITINGGGTVANTGSNLVLGGGSRTTTNASSGAGVAAGTLSTATGTSIELNGALLVNNGTQAGTLNVNYGSQARGTCQFGNVTVNEGGQFGNNGATSGSSGAGNMVVQVASPFARVLSQSAVNAQPFVGPAIVHDPAGYQRRPTSP